MLKSLKSRAIDSWRDLQRELAEQPPAVRWGLAGGAALAGVLACAYAFLDTSAELAPAQVSQLQQFAEATGSERVMERYRDVSSDGSVTVRETDEVIEAAKSAAPEYGLASSIRQ